MNCWNKQCRNFKTIFCEKILSGPNVVRINVIRSNVVSHLFVSAFSSTSVCCCCCNFPARSIINSNNYFHIWHFQIREKDRKFVLAPVPLITAKIKPTGRNLGRVFNSRCGRACLCHAITFETKTGSLKVESLAQTPLRSSPVSFCTPRSNV